MTLRELLDIFGRIQWGQTEPDSVALGIEVDSRGVVPGTIFVAIRGEGVDGHDFLEAAAINGATVLVVESAENIPGDYPGTVLEVLDSKWALAELMSRFHAKPEERLISIGITGTNGKTSTSYILEALLNEAHVPCGVIGTIDHHFKERVWKTELTTPDTKTFYQRLNDFLSLGAKAFVMEVSSHGLKQGRVPIRFDMALFTNFTRDHLDYHETMDDYLKSKELLFSKHLKEDGDVFVGLNEDDSQVSRTRLPKHVMRLSFGKNADADFQYKIDKMSYSGSEFRLSYPSGVSQLYSSPLTGHHNVANMVSALCLAHGMGISELICERAIRHFRGIPGRLQKVESTSGIHAFVDYAHTPDALEQSLKTLSDIRMKHNISNRIFCVFGCGGDRDQGKRPQMAKIAGSYADVIIVTSDNPRSEDPQSIIEDILSGFMSDATVVSEVDRGKALLLAINQADDGDVILVAGKGHEDYQIIGDEKLYFSDIEVMKELLEGAR